MCNHIMRFIIITEVLKIISFIKGNSIRISIDSYETTSSLIIVEKESFNES